MIAYRKHYLEEKVKNRDRNGVPKTPEVYLDERYFNEHHAARQRWLCEDRVAYTKSGKGKRYCITGARIVYKRNDARHDEWVRDSLEFRQADLAPSPDHDYHGNFSHAAFSQWFTKLCSGLTQDYGGCSIFMNGAAYHKYVENKQPTTAWNNNSVEEGTWSTKWQCMLPLPRQVCLRLRAHTRQTLPTLLSAWLAVEHGHHVFYTPSYHPKLQPIELV